MSEHRGREALQPGGVAHPEARPRLRHAGEPPRVLRLDLHDDQGLIVTVIDINMLLRQDYNDL